MKTAKRFFLVFFRYVTKQGSSGHGNSTVETEGKYINCSEFEGTVKKGLGFFKVSVTGINELSESDYNDAL